MHRSATSVWKDALAQVNGLPDCPPDLNEPQYVKLVFDPTCHVRFSTYIYTFSRKLTASSFAMRPRSILFCGLAALEAVRSASIES